MKVFTFVAVAFIPEVVLGSYWGMNVPVPWGTSGEPEDSSTTAWLGIFSLSVLISISIFIFFKYLKYI